MKQPDDLLLYTINKFLINFTDIFYYIIEKSNFNYNFIIKSMTYYYISVKSIPRSCDFKKKIPSFLFAMSAKK